METFFAIILFLYWNISLLFIIFANAPRYLMVIGLIFSLLYIIKYD